jgi:hypothetical protein
MNRYKQIEEEKENNTKNRQKNKSVSSMINKATKNKTMISLDYLIN